MSGQSARTLGKHVVELKKEYLKYSKIFVNKIVRKLPEEVRENIIQFPVYHELYDEIVFILDLDEITMDATALAKIFSEVCQVDKMFIEVSYDEIFNRMIVRIQLSGWTTKRYLLIEYD